MKDILKQIVIRSLALESRLVLKKYNPKIVAITGTVGKTSTKDAIYQALSQFVSVRRSPKSFNSELGVPLTILGAKNPGDKASGWFKVLIEGVILILFPNHYPEWLVLEVGTDRPGDIKALTKYLKPDVVVVTRLAEIPVHVEAFNSPEDLFEEKGHLVRSLKPEGLLVLNASDKKVLAYEKLFGGRKVFFGRKNSDITAENYEIFYDEEKMPKGVAFDVISRKEGDLQQPSRVCLEGTLGESHIQHILAALAVIDALGEDVHLALKGFKNARPLSGRMRIIEGVNGSCIIDDTYNSSPVAVEEALKTLKKLSGKRRVAVLGDMLELGRFTVDEHRQVGERVAKVVKLLAVVGIRSRYTAEQALMSGLDEKKVLQFDDSRSAGKALKEFIKKGDIILVKGSQGMRMERVVEELMAHPEDKERFLVRQDKEWQNRQ